MEVQLQELIDRIKEEGFKEAEKNALQIKKQAEKEAFAIIAEANKKAKDIIENAKTDSEKLKITGKQAIIQAGRDIILKIKYEISSILKSIIRDEIKASMTQDVLKDVITKLINAWVDKGSTDIKILLSENDRNNLENYFTHKLSDKIKKGVDLLPIKSIESGFRIMEKDGSSFYDITDEGVAEALSGYLNPILKDCLSKAIEDGGKV